MKIFLFLLSVAGFIFYLQQDKNQSVSLQKVQMRKTEPLQINETNAEINDFKNNIKNIESMTTEQLNEEIQKIELRLEDFSDLSYEKFTEQQLNEFNALVQKKAVYLKKYIFKKYSAAYAVEKI